MATNNETIDADTGEVIEGEAGMMIPVRESEAGAGTGVQVSPDYKPTTLLDYSALMMAARAHPRDTNLAIKQAEAIVTMSETTARECFYALPRGGKKISGESVGMAETLASCYGNMNITTDDIKVLREEGVVQVRGFILDCETGLTYSSIIRRSILDKKGELFSNDMINQTTGAAISILYRNLVLRIIPRPIRKHIYARALAVASGGGKTFAERQQKCVAHWEEEMGVDKAKLLLHLGYTQVTDLNIQDFEYLLGIENAISTGDIKVEEVFKKDFLPPKPGEKAASIQEVTADLKAKEAAQEQPEPPMPDPELTPEQTQERQEAVEQPVTAEQPPPPADALAAAQEPVTASTDEPEPPTAFSEPAPPAEPAAPAYEAPPEQTQVGMPPTKEPAKAPGAPIARPEGAKGPAKR